MPDKQKVTLYLSDDLHRQFKIRSAVDGETMSAMAQRALKFYLSHADLVENPAGGYGRTHQVHNCPQCKSAVALNDNSLILVRNHSSHVQDDLLGIEEISSLTQQDSSVQTSSVADVNCKGEGRQDSKSPDEGELITC